MDEPVKAITTGAHFSLDVTNELKSYLDLSSPTRTLVEEIRNTGLTSSEVFRVVREMYEPNSIVLIARSESGESAEFAFKDSVSIGEDSVIVNLQATQDVLGTEFTTVLLKVEKNIRASELKWINYQY